MFEPFPTNYIWNLSINLAIEMGGAIGDIDTANRIVAEAAKTGDAGSAAFFDSWVSMGERVAELAEEDLAAGNVLTAATKFARATAYYITAERMQARDYAPRRAAYARMLALFAKHIALADPDCTPVEIPYGGSFMPALFCSASSAEKPTTPCMVFCNGLDSTKEMVYLVRITHALRARGISCLIVDQPGVGGGVALEQASRDHRGRKMGRRGGGLAGKAAGC